MLKRTWAEVNLDNLAHNVKILRESLPDGCRFLGVVKADAYGHGAVSVARELENLNAEYLAVSNYEEALQLRRAEIHLPILILGYTPAEFAREEAASAYYTGGSQPRLWTSAFRSIDGQRPDTEYPYED